MSKQSSIDWLVDKLTDMIHESHHDELVELMQKARKMHRQEIVEAANNGCGEGMCSIDRNRDGENYYTQTYGGSDEG